MHYSFKYCLPVSNVIPATVFLVVTLHGSHVARAVQERQTRGGWLIGVMNIKILQGQRQWDRCTFVGLCLPLTARNNLRAV